MMQKKGQGAMEYLMTYGWAILVVVIVGVVLWQMGVFNPSGGKTASFSGFGSVKPIEWSCSVAAGDISVMWTNGAGGTITGLTMAADGGTPADCVTNTSSAGDKFQCELGGVTSCSTVSAGDRFSTQLELTYTSPTGLNRTSTGTVWGAAEP